MHHNRTLIQGLCRRQRESCSCFIWGWEEAPHPGSALPREIRETWPPTSRGSPGIQASICTKLVPEVSFPSSAGHPPLPPPFPAFSLLLSSPCNQLTFFTTRKQSNNLFSCFGSSSQHHHLPLQRMLSLLPEPDVLCSAKLLFQPPSGEYPLGCKYLCFVK